jgi:hypothetical protein
LTTWWSFSDSCYYFTSYQLFDHSEFLPPGHP